MSSGMLTTSRDQYVECDGEVVQTFPLFGDGPKFDLSWPCTFAGEVEVFIDVEIYAAMWECPRCGREHDVSREVFS